MLLFVFLLVLKMLVELVGGGDGGRFAGFIGVVHLGVTLFWSRPRTLACRSWGAYFAFLFVVDVGSRLGLGIKLQERPCLLLDVVQLF